MLPPAAFPRPSDSIQDLRSSGLYLNRQSSDRLAAISFTTAAETILTDRWPNLSALALVSHKLGTRRQVEHSRRKAGVVQRENSESRKSLFGHAMRVARGVHGQQPIPLSALGADVALLLRSAKGPCSTRGAARSPYTTHAKQSRFEHASGTPDAASDR